MDCSYQATTHCILFRLVAALGIGISPEHSKQTSSAEGEHKCLITISGRWLAVLWQVALVFSIPLFSDLRSAVVVHRTPESIRETRDHSESCQCSGSRPAARWSGERPHPPEAEENVCSCDRQRCGIPAAAQRPAAAGADQWWQQRFFQVWTEDD